MSGEPRTLTHSVDIDLVGVAKLKSVSPEPSDQGVINGETTILRFRVQDGERITLDMGRRQVEVVVNPRAGGGYPVAARDEAAELRAALEMLLNACHRGGVNAGLTIEAVERAEALIAPSLTREQRVELARAAWREGLKHRLAASEGQP